MQPYTRPHPPAHSSTGSSTASSLSHVPGMPTADPWQRGGTSAPCPLLPPKPAPAPAGCWLGIRVSRQGKPVPGTGPAWPRGEAAPAPSTCTTLFQLLRHSSRVDDYLCQSLPYLWSPQEPLQEAAVRFIGESQPHGPSVPHSSSAPAPAAAESATWLQSTACSKWAWSACGAPCCPRPPPAHAVVVVGSLAGASQPPWVSSHLGTHGQAGRGVEGGLCLGRAGQRDL